MGSRARAFYADKLGLTPTREEPAGLVYETPGGAWFRLYRTPCAGTAQHTIAGWEVEGLEAEVAELRARGWPSRSITLGSSRRWTALPPPRATRVAWFKDSEGNLLGLARTS
jgi:hypothetical protein